MDNRRPGWAQRTGRRWIAAGIAIYAARVIAYLTLSDDTWRFVGDHILSEGLAWGCFVIAAWRRGYHIGWTNRDTKDPR